MKAITRTVWVLCWISLFNDAASEMLYPVLPVYLKSIGFSVALIGVLEGIAEALAGLSKGYFGKLSDSTGKRTPFVQIGYGLSVLSRPLLGLFTWPWWVFIARTTDRLGKGVRTAARDAILSDEATPTTKGQVFGLHRSMDTLGAVIGPLLALGYLLSYPGRYRDLFFVAAIPGLAALLLTFFLNKNGQKTSSEEKKFSLKDFLSFWRSAGAPYRRVVAGMWFFALFNSSDVFLLLKVKEAGLSDTYVIGFYIFFNLIFAVLSWPLGMLADRIGLRRMYIIGVTAFALTYMGMGIGHGLYFMASMFVLYGVYAAATDGISKAWISNLVPKSDTATAIGAYAALQSLCSLAASTLTGLIWYRFGATTALLVTAAAATLTALYFGAYIPLAEKRAKA